MLIILVLCHQSAGASQTRRVPSQNAGMENARFAGTSATGNHNIQKVNKWIWDESSL